LGFFVEQHGPSKDTLIVEDGQMVHQVVIALAIAVPAPTFIGLTQKSTAEDNPGVGAAFFHPLANLLSLQMSDELQILHLAGLVLLVFVADGPERESHDDGAEAQQRAQQSAPRREGLLSG